MTNFGIDNPDGLADAVNATGHDNLYTYIADLNPYDPGDRFAVVEIVRQPAETEVAFERASAARVYRLLHASDLVDGTWTILSGGTWTPGVPGRMTLGDPDAEAIRFYRVEVSVP